MRKSILILPLVLLFTGCATIPTDSVAKNVKTERQAKPDQPDIAGYEKPATGDIKKEVYGEPPGPLTSLLKSDRQVLNEASIKKILSSRVVLPRKGHLAIIRFPGHERSAPSYFGREYWNAEDYLKTRQGYMDTLSEKLAESKRIVAVTLLPSLLTPLDATIPVLREASIRIQADLLLVFRITSDIYQQYKNADNGQVKAFSTCEAVLMDIRTGLIPYTTVVTRESLQEMKSTDFDINEVKKTAEREAALASLNVVAGEISEFLNSVP